MKRTMSRWRVVIVAAVYVLLLTGCRQPEGTVPTPQGDQPNRIVDISRDLQNVARKDPNASSELFDDLTTLETTAPRPPERVKALAQSLSDALGGTNLPDAEAKRIADLLFIARATSDLSAAQIERVGTDLQETLVKVGAAPDPAGRVSAAAIALAEESTSNPKRWYQR